MKDWPGGTCLVLELVNSGQFVFKKKIFFINCKCHCKSTQLFLVSEGAGSAKPSSGHKGLHRAHHSDVQGNTVTQFVLHPDVAATFY